MKLVFSCMLMLVSYFAFTQSKTTHEKDSLVGVLSKMDLEQFEKKKTNYFISRIPSNYQVEIITSNNFNYPYTAILKFPDRPYVEIRLLYEKLKHTNPNSISMRKVARQLKKETIQKLEIYDEYLCVNGCDD